MNARDTEGGKAIITAEFFDEFHSAYWDEFDDTIHFTSACFDEVSVPYKCLIGLVNDIEEFKVSKRIENIEK